MLKLSKYHKTADEEKNPEPKDEEVILQGSEVEDDVEDAEEEDGALAKSPKFDARREAATPHANAAKDLFSKRRELMKQVSMLDDELGKHRDVLRALDPKVRHEAYADDKELRDYLKPEKQLDKKRKKKLDKKSADEVIEGLLKVAEVLDYAGHPEGVSYVESMLHIFAKEDAPSRPLYGVETVDKTERKYPEAAFVPPSMSTRHCPDHNGSQLKRVAEGSFQCDLDGRIYNWDEGFKDYSGNVYPPSTISSVDFPDGTEALFEDRDMALSKRQK